MAAKKVATRGPVPKRATTRAGHRTKAETPERVAAPSEPVQSPKVSPHWHPLAKTWYTSLRRSGQSALYEPSDWELARLTATLLSRALRDESLNASLLGKILAAMASLGTSEGDRRRLRLEIDRGAATSTVTRDDLRRQLNG